MALVKRGKTWHTHFFVDGQRYRKSLGTFDWREAQKKEKQLVAQASQGKVATLSQQFSKLTFEGCKQKPRRAQRSPCSTKHSDGA